MAHIIVKSVVKGLIYAILIVAVLWLTQPLMQRAGSNDAFPPVTASKWQAVFLTGGQVYFGRLSDVGNGYVTLSNVYYLKSASELEQGNLNLVKLGGELHGPEDTIYIRKESISFWENMKDTSRVVQSIQSAKQ